jgi:hypothetical protein
VDEHKLSDWRERLKFGIIPYRRINAPVGAFFTRHLRLAIHCDFVLISCKFLSGNLFDQDAIADPGGGSVYPVMDGLPRETRILQGLAIFFGQVDVHGKKRYTPSKIMSTYFHISH